MFEKLDKVNGPFILILVWLLGVIAMVVTGHSWEAFLFAFVPALCVFVAKHID